MVQRELSLELSVNESMDALTRLFHIYYLLDYAFSDIRPQIDGERRSASAKLGGSDS